MRRRKLMVVAATILVALPVASATAQPGPADHRDERPAQDTGHVLDSFDLDAIQMRLTLEHPNSFAGISFDDDARTATVHYKEGTDTSWLDEELAVVVADPFHETRLGFVNDRHELRVGRSADDLTPRSPYRVVTRSEQRSLAELDAERARFADSELGAYVVFDRVVPDRNKIQVTLHTPPPSSRVTSDVVLDAAAEAVANGALIIDVDWSITEPLQTYVGRWDDPRPHKAGLRIVGPQGQRCTGGPIVRPIDGEHRTMLTAAHCGERKSRWETPTGRFVGRMANRAFGENFYDSARVRKPNGPQGFAPRIYGGGPTGTDLYWVRGAFDAGIDEPVCSSGASLGDQCGDDDDVSRVRNRNVCANFSDIDKRTCFLDVADATGAGPGDSGGPVYQEISSPPGRLIAGTVVGGNSDFLLYHPIGRLLDRWNAELLVR